jgi:two-component sensor histidine kinase
VLVKEINHRVKNSLQLVAGLLNMQATDDPEIGRLLRQASSRIMAIGRAHDRLYRSSQIETIELGDYLSAICKDLEEVTTNCDVSFEASKALFLTTDRAIGVALVVTELVVNGARHAYPEGMRGRIWVRLATSEGEAASVSVRDAGVGLSADFETSRSAGLGMRLVRALAKQTGAQLRIERRLPGTEFILEIPLNANVATEAG